MTTDVWARLVCEAAGAVLRHARHCDGCAQCVVLFHRLAVAEAGWFASRLST